MYQKKTNNPELGTGWHRKKRVKITTTYKQPKYKQIPSIKRPTPNPKTNKQTNSFESMICPIKFIAQVFRYYYNNITNYMNTYRNADSKNKPKPLRKMKTTACYSTSAPFYLCAIYRRRRKLSQWG